MNPAAVQTAIFGVLSSDPTLLSQLSTSWSDVNGAIPAIFSEVPQENHDDDDFYPFISFGEDVTAPFDTKTSTGGDATMPISVWTRTADYIQAKTIAKRVYDLLHRQDLTISNANHVTTDMLTTEFSLDPDGSTRRGLLTFSVLYEDT